MKGKEIKKNPYLARETIDEDILINGKAPEHIPPEPKTERGGGIQLGRGALLRWWLVRWLKPVCYVLAG
jgi:hypothetical protein